MKVTYLGHSAFIIEGNGIKALIDPFITNNPHCSTKADEFINITHIFVTHGHSDHVGDTEKIARKNDSLIICNHELGFFFSNMDLKVHAMHIGGRKKFDFGTVKMTPALHGSGYMDSGDMKYGGNPCGFLIEIDGKKLYHAGDTGLTMDMKLLEIENIDLALIPIGGNFTMDAEDAVRAVEFIHPKLVIPMHYGTFPIIEADPEKFKEKVIHCGVQILKPGNSMNV